MNVFLNPIAQIEKLKDQIEVLKQDKSELELILEEEEHTNKTLKRENQKLQHAQTALVNLNEEYVEKRKENKEMSTQIQEMLEQL